LVVGGTRQLPGLWRARRRGIPVIQRLDGMNWLHRLPPTAGRPRASLRHVLRAEYGNLNLALVRSRLASAVVYQSEFSCSWWERAHGPTPVPKRVVYNGVDLETFQPLPGVERPQDRWRLLLLEGSLMGGYEFGLTLGVQLAGELAGLLRGTRLERLVELRVVGRVDPQAQSEWDGLHASKTLPAGVALSWAGLQPHERIPAIDNAAHLLYSADVNAACPNAVIEAMACGLPVIAFDSGALAELVREGAGRVVPYGGDPWRLEPPDVPGLAQAALEVLQGQERYRPAARRRAQAQFGLERMVDGYWQVLSQV
jgi:glycosyltransferase involved in cell wall biosynthesis